MIEADNNLKLLPPSISGIYKVFEHIDMLCIIIHYQPYTVIPSLHTTWLLFYGSWSLMGSKWCHYIMIEAANHLKLRPISILDIIKCLSTLMCCPLAYSISLTQLTLHTTSLWFLGSGVTCGVKMMPLHHNWGWQPPQNATTINIRHIYTKCLSTLICCPSAYSSPLTQ